eukprot:373090-Pelagomonas_calceolata.AAC.1
MKVPRGPSVRYGGVYGGVQVRPSPEPCVGNGIGVGPGGLCALLGCLESRDNLQTWHGSVFFLHPDEVQVLRARQYLCINNSALDISYQ